MDVKKSDIVRDPAAIERRSMEIIGDELAKREIEIAPENLPVVKRAIHASADFDYAENLRFLNDPVAAGIITMALRFVRLMHQESKKIMTLRSYFSR